MNEAEFIEVPELVDYSETDRFEWAFRNDGRWAGLLIFGLVFGPRIPPVGLLPPIRSVDVLILLLLLVRWVKTRRYYGGFLFSPRVRLFSGFMLFWSFVLIFSTVLGVLQDRYPFYLKDFYVPIAFARMVIIAAIMASFHFGRRQIIQFARFLAFTSFLLVALAFVQKYKPWLVSGIVERFYGIGWERLERTGLASRVVGTVGNPNIFSGFLGILAASSLAFVIFLKGFVRLLSAIAFVVLGGALLFTTGSRTGMAVFTVVTFFSLLLSLQGRARIWVLLLLIIMAGSFVFLRMNIDSLPINPRLKTVIAGGSEGMSEGMQARYRIWRDSYTRAKESIIFGVGASKMIIQTTDNGYLITLLRTGIIGLGLYLTMLLLLTIRSIRTFFYEREPIYKGMLMLSVSVLLTHGLFEMTGDFFWGVEYGSFVAAFLGLLLCVSRDTLDERIYLSSQSIQ